MLTSRRSRRLRWQALVAASCVALLVSACSTVIDGRLLSGTYDPFFVDGLPVRDGASGPRDDAPAPVGTVKNSDGGQIDDLVLLSLNDVADFWTQHYGDTLQGTFTPVTNFVSYDPQDPASPEVCGSPTYRQVNAFFCPSRDLIGWDRAVLLPTAEKYFGPVAVTAVMAHEYGHAVQLMADLVTRRTPVLVREQQADCFAGDYVRWVAAGDSPRFTLSTGDGLNHVLAGAIAMRDEVITPGAEDLLEQGHGTALDRVSAFQMGFIAGAQACADIDMAHIEARRADLPLTLQVQDSGLVQSGEVRITEDTLQTLMEVLGAVFNPADPPTLSTVPDGCPDSPASPAPASYCPDTNTVHVDLEALQDMSIPATESDYVLVQGDDTALSAVTSRYVLALQDARGLDVTSAATGLRTACLTGFAQRSMAEPIDIPSGDRLQLTAGDLDEAIAGLLTNGIAASDVSGATAPAGFSRIAAFRSGLASEQAQACYQRFK